VEVATIIGLYGFYEVVRGQGHASLGVAREHTDGIVALERHLHFGERMVQQAAHWVPGLPTLLGIAYIAMHFLGTAAFLIWLYRTHPERFPLVRNTLIAATGVALSIYLLYPVAPPRLAGLGFVDTVTRNAKVNLSSTARQLLQPVRGGAELHWPRAARRRDRCGTCQEPRCTRVRLDLSGRDAAGHRRDRQPLLLRRCRRRARDWDRLRCR
jgi:hypothetical protein